MSSQQDKGKLVKHPRHSNYFLNSVTKIIYYREDRDGKSIKFSCRTTKITEAIKFAEAKLTELRGEQVETKGRKNVKNPKLSDLWADLIQLRNVKASKRTQEIYETVWRLSINPFWGSKHTSDINQKNVLKFVDWFEKERGVSFNNTHKYLNMLFNHAQKKGLLREKPEIPHLDRINAKNKRKEKVGRVYTDREISKLLSASQKLETEFSSQGNEVRAWSYRRVYLGILFASRMGLRKSEFLSIEWARVDFKKGLVTVWRKNKYWAELAIPGVLLNELIKERAMRPDTGLVFESSSRPGAPISSQKFDVNWTEVKVAAGIRRATDHLMARIHDLRHTFATRTAEDNWNATIACSYLDMDIKVYQDVYVHTSADMMRKLIEDSFGGEI